MTGTHRNTVYLEDAEVIAHEAHEGNQYILRVSAPSIAVHARAGSFAHIQCDPQLPMRRPISIMRVDPGQGSVDFLYKVVGEGTRLLARRRPRERLSVLGPIGKPFHRSDNRPRPLLLGGGVGMPPMIFMADEMRREHGWKPFMVLGSEVPFPFTPRPSEIVVPGMPSGVIAAMPLAEDWGIASRLTSGSGLTGCHQGFVTDLARCWLDALGDEQRGEVEVFACGPHPMLEAVAALAREYDLPCQVSLEEFMACGIGGCAGCAVQVRTDDGPAMKRVCVDGPVFDARSVF